MTARLKMAVSLAAVALGVGAGAATATSESQAGLLWSHTLTGETYVDYDVSIGNRGSRVFSDSGLFTRRTRLYSTQSASGSPLWQASSSTDGYSQRVDSSQNADVHAVCRLQDASTPGQRIAVVECYDSNSSLPRWTFQFPQTTVGEGGNFIRVAADGSWVAAGLKSSSELHLVVFEPGQQGSNPSPFMDVRLPFFGELLHLGIAEDLSTVYCANLVRATVYDPNTGGVRYDKLIFGGEARGHTSSADGKTLTYTKDGGYVVVRDEGNGYQAVDHLKPFDGSSNYRIGPAAFSSDGKTLVGTYDNLSNLRTVHTIAWDLSGGTFMRMNDTTTSQHPTISNLVTDVAISDGPLQRIALSVRGDNGGSSPEIKVFQREQFGQSFDVHAQIQRPGTPFSLDLSSDGRRLAASGRDVPAVFTSGNKVVEAFDLGTDIRVLGSARVGGTVPVEFYTTSSSTLGFLLEASQPSQSPVPMNFGTLYLSRPLVTRTPLGQANGQGKIVFQYSVDGLFAGQTVYLQGLNVNSGTVRLSRDWTSITVLP